MGDDEPLKLERLHRDILAPHVESFLSAAGEGEAKAQYASLRDAIEAQEIPAALTPRLGAVAEVLLSSGRVRNLYGPGAELALWSLFKQTPQGREISASVDAVNSALRRLHGQSLKSLNTVMRGPGAYSLMLETNECQIAVRFERSGVRVENVEIGSE
jgi:hypothetical protein